MDNDLLKILSEELRETKKLVLETNRLANAAENTARAAEKKADAAWELVVITREQVKEELAYMKRPFWKKFSVE